VCVCVSVCSAGTAGDTAASVAPTSPSVALLDILIIKHLPKVMGNPNGKKLFLLLLLYFFLLDVGFCRHRVPNIIKLLMPNCHFKYYKV